jgi:Domain of unknown function (DUF4251)
MKNIKAFLILFTINILAASFIVKAQDKTPDEIKKIVESQNYIFKAQMANPQTGSSRSLTPEYDLTITRDTIISDLPYFGRAYAAPVDPAEGGIKFTSTSFEYKPAKHDKGWEIMIKPKDARDVQQLYLEIFNNGNTTLQIISTNRQGISFNGYIEEGKPTEKKAF